MRLLDQYIGRQIASSTLFGILILSIVFVFGNVFKQLMPLFVSGVFTFEFAFRFFLYTIPYTLTYTIPWGFLVAVLLVSGRLSADNELTSMKLAGLSMARICLPIILFSLLCSLFCFYSNTVLAPHARFSIGKIFREALLKDPLKIFQPGEAVSTIPDTIIYVGAKEGNILRDFHLIKIKEKAPLQTISARQAEVEVDKESLILELTLKDVHVDMRDSRDPNNFDKIRPGNTIDVFPLDISLASLKTTETDPASFKNSKLKHHLQTKQLTPSEKIDYRIELSKRYSLSLACIVFCFIGIPLGRATQRRETSIGFAISLAIASTYFFLIILADLFETDERIAHTIMWSPNILGLSAGGYLFYLVNRR